MSDYPPRANRCSRSNSRCNSRWSHHQLAQPKREIQTLLLLRYLHSLGLARTAIIVLRPAAAPCSQARQEVRMANSFATNDIVIEVVLSAGGTETLACGHRPWRVRQDVSRPTSALCLLPACGTANSCRQTAQTSSLPGGTLPRLLLRVCLHFRL